MWLAENSAWSTHEKTKKVLSKGDCRLRIGRAIIPR